MPLTMSFGTPYSKVRLLALFELSRPGMTLPLFPYPCLSSADSHLMLLRLHEELRRTRPTLDLHLSGQSNCRLPISNDLAHKQWLLLGKLGHLEFWSSPDPGTLPFAPW